MNIEIVAIGNELLSGFTVNTNASFISAELLKDGFLVSRHTVLPDDETILLNGLQEALKRNQLVISTGGLGPTCDDRTRKIAAELMDSGFRYDEEVAAELRRRYGDNLLSITDQATVPVKAHLLKNLVGTAPGLIFKKDDVTWILLPGVPPEMRSMWTNEVAPYLKKHFPSETHHYFKRANFFGISESMIDPVLRELNAQYPEVDFGIYPGQMVLGVHLTIVSDNQKKAMDLLDKPYKVIVEKFAAHFFDAESGKIEDAVHDRFIRNHWTLTVAESCTGGSVAARLTRRAGASQFFLGSTVCYSNAMKEQMLEVPAALLNQHGAVSEEAVSAMLQGVFATSDCEFGAAVTGIAGPSGGTQKKPVGTVWCAVGRRGSTPHVWKLNMRGNREMVIDRSVNMLLAGLLQYTDQLRD